MLEVQHTCTREGRSQGVKARHMRGRPCAAPLVKTTLLSETANGRRVSARRETSRRRRQRNERERERAEKAHREGHYAAIPELVCLRARCLTGGAVVKRERERERARARTLPARGG